MTNTHVLPTTPDTTLSTVWRCIICFQQTNPFADAVCPGPGLHAHVANESRDCDGRYSRTSVQMMNEEERKSVFSDLDFKARMLSNAVSWDSPGEVSIDEDGFEASVATEEGWRNTSVKWCEDNCTYDTSFRDHSAEAAGY